MKKLWLIISFCSILFMAGCTSQTATNPPPPSPSPSESTTVERPSIEDNVGSEEITPLDSIIGIDLTEEPPLTFGSGDIAAPAFLDEEGQSLYHKAYSLYQHMFGGDTTEIEYSETIENPVSDWSTYETVTINDRNYYISQGRYAKWADFDALIHSVFTDRFWSERNSFGDDSNKEFLYTEYQGHLCFMDTARGSGYYYDENAADEFTLIAKTDTEISFTLIGHYMSESGIGYTIEFPIKMVLTSDGWRFDEFYTALGDEKSIEEVH